MKIVTASEALALITDENTENYPFASLNAEGVKQTLEFADAFYGSGGYMKDGVIAHIERSDVDVLKLIEGRDHSVEFKTANRGMFGGFKVENLRLGAECFDFLVHE